MIQTFKQTHHYFYHKSEKIIIVPHKNPDGDALGSATAFMEYTKHLNKEGLIFCTTPIPERWQFLNHVKGITHDPAVFKDPRVSTIVVLDSGDLHYAGIDQLINNHSAQIINIDHHTTNEYFGHFNLVMPNASSTTEVLYKFFKHNNVPFSPLMATALLTGFITDTDSFTNSATSAEAFSAASDLIHQGAHVHAISHSTIKNKSVEALKLWGVVLSRLKKHEPLNLTYTYITQKDLIEYHFDDNESEGLANFLNNLGDTKVALILKETSENTIKGSFRTIHDGVDVSVLAKKMGGGGHKKAAGFTTTGTINEVLQKILTIS